jgi:hypothetical protein
MADFYDDWEDDVPPPQLPANLDDVERRENVRMLGDDV